MSKLLVASIGLASGLSLELAGAVPVLEQQLHAPRTTFTRVQDGQVLMHQVADMYYDPPWSLIPSVALLTSLLLFALLTGLYTFH